MKKKKYNAYTKTIDDTIKLPEKQGNGILKYSVSINKKGKVARYSFSYINFHIYAGDNGRVLGYDNCHGNHHRHFMGEENKIEFISLEDVQNQFEAEWEKLHEKVKKQKNHRKIN